MQHWSKPTSPVGKPCPLGRHYHASVCLGWGENHPQLLVIGGWGGGRALSDMWLLEVHSLQWKEVRLIGYSVLNIDIL